LKKRKTIIKFLAKFFVVYFVLLGIYSFYLKQTQQRLPVFSCSPITKTVAHHTHAVAKWLGYDTVVQQTNDELSMMFFVENVYAVPIVEGCNSISVLILFLSFIIAFAGSLKATIIFGAFGIFAIYCINILRILALSKLMYVYPEYQDILHNLFFPAVIYGAVFVLWIIWVNKFSYLKKAR
jgi:exosortase family protein XrtF